MWPAKSELSSKNEEQKHSKSSERKKDEMFRPCRHETWDENIFGS